MSHPAALIRKNLWSLKNTIRLLRYESKLKLGFVTLFAIAFEVSLGLLFLNGFRFLDRLGGAGTVLIGRLFPLFFLGMGVMLIASGIVTSYATLFRSAEVPFLFLLPLRTEQVVLYKFCEAVVLSSWAFFFVVIPFMAAYTCHARLAAFFTLWTVFFSLPFLILCSGIGGLVALMFQRWLARTRILRILLIIAPAIFLLALLRAVFNIKPATGGLGFALSQILPGLKLATNPLLPSYWLSEGVDSLARGMWLRGLMFYALLASTAVVVCICVETLGGLVFREAWQRSVAGNDLPRRPSLLGRWLDCCPIFLPPEVHAIMVKDLRTFLRDPLQWSQALIFFGLLGMYFANLRTFGYHELPDAWRNAIGFLNVFSLSAVVCSLGARFLYPQLSLEGHGFWILGLSGLRMRRILLVKFFTALCALFPVSMGLMALSGHMLQTTLFVRVVSLVLGCGISFAVCGLSLGLGAVFLDLERRNPAAIVSGFGGTLNLVLNLVLMLATILPLFVLFHFQNSPGLAGTIARRGMALGIVWLVMVCGMATVIPLLLGARALERREF